MRNDLEIYESHISCGIRELCGVAYTDTEVFKCVVAEKTTARGDCRYFEKNYTYIFSDNNDGNGAKLASLIRRSGLGTIHCTPWRTNPNSGNKIKAWTWRYNGRIPAAWKKLEWNDDLEDSSSDWRSW